MTTSVPQNESARLEALRKYRLLNADTDDSFDDLTRLAATICDVPIALMVLVDSERMWLKSRYGLDVTSIPREDTFCSDVVFDSKTLVIDDTAANPDFCTKPLVISEPHIRFYAGAPLINADGHVLGTLCLIDQKPRSISARVIETLEALARQVVAQMELQRVARDLADALEGVKTLKDLLPVCAWCKSVRNDAGYWKRVEDYLHQLTGAGTTHGICPDCFDKQLTEVRG